MVSWFDIEKARCPMHMHEKMGLKLLKRLPEANVK